jgi:hypothetical protein
MRAENICAARKIRNRPRHPQNAMHRSRRELQQIDRVFEHRLIVRCEPTHRIRFRLVEMRIAAACALPLHFACLHDACAHDIAGFAGRRIGSQFGRRQSRDFEVQVDAFEQGAGDLRAIALDRVGVAAAAA